MTGRRSRAWSSRAWRPLLAAGGLAWALWTMPYFNWQPIALPVDARPLTIRHDGKGDGSFLAPRGGGRVHRGVDLLAPLASPVRAIWSGRVAEVGIHRGLGRFVELDHGRLGRSLSAHLDQAQVAVGQRVRQGQPIGTIGKTGNARHHVIQPHLHLEVWRRGDPVDPASVGLAVVASEHRGDGASGEGGR